MEGDVKKVLKDFNELVMMGHAIFSLPFIFIAMIVSAQGWFGWRLLLLGALAALTARNFAMAFNRYVDRDIDAQNERTKHRPSVDGRLSAQSVRLFMIVNALGFMVVAYSINTLAFMLAAPILVVLALYSYFKRFSGAAHVVLGISLGFAPIAGAVAVSQSIPLWSMALACGVMFWVAGFDILYSLQDMEFDKKAGLYSIPSRFGPVRALWISRVFHLLTLLFWLLFAYLIEAQLFTYAAVFMSAVLLAYEHIIVAQDFKQINKAFFTVNGYLGMLFLLLVILDYGVMR